MTLLQTLGRLLPVVLALAGSGVAVALCGNPADDEFSAENNAAMSRMMTAMEIRPSGDVDRDFVAMMIPHHQGAIDMALAELRHGHSEQLRRIAQEIIVDQQQEIAAMNFALDQPLPPSTPAPTQGAPASNSMDMSSRAMSPHATH